MVPLHPKLRSQIVNDSELKAQGLSDVTIRSWDQHVTRLYYLKQYNPDVFEKYKDDFDAQTKELIGRFIPRLKTIYQKWIAYQKKSINESYFSLSPGKLFRNGFIISWFWLITLFSSRKKAGLRK